MRRGAMPAPQNLRATGDRIEQAARRTAGRPPIRAPSTGPRSCCAWSPSSTAPGWPAWWRWPRRRRPSWSTTSPPTSWWPACCWSQGLHPEALDDRVEAGPGPVRPFLGRHGGDVELLGVDEEAGAVRLRLLGSCDGCPSSAATLQGAVERAILEAAPEVMPHRGRGADADGRGPVPVALGRQAALRRVPECEVATRDRAASPCCSASAAVRRVPAEPVEECCELCAEPDRRRARPPGRPAVPDLAVRLPRVLPPVRVGGCRRRSLPRPCPSGTWRFPTSSCPRPSGTACRSRSAWPSSSSTRPSTGWPPSTPARPGATESELPLDTWDELVAANPAAGDHAARRRGVPGPCRTDRGDGTECYIVPIDACYELVGQLRTTVARLRRRHRGQRANSMASSPPSGRRRR